MKLYATTTSERASKGQGGKQQVDILLQVDPKLRVQVGRVVMRAEPNGYTIKYYPICGASYRATEGKNVITLLDTTIGEKQKDDCRGCYDCEAPTGYTCGTTPEA